MLALDFINVGNGDSILIRELENGQQRYALMVDFGHDCLVRDDHPGELDPRSQRIYAGDFLRELGVERLDMALATHFHRDHIGGLGRVLDVDLNKVAHVIQFDGMGTPRSISLRAKLEKIGP